MSYTKGEAYIGVPNCLDVAGAGTALEPYHFRQEDEPYTDCQHPPGYGHAYGSEVGQVNLPHSCGEWNIGGRAEVQALISDLIRLHDLLPEEDRQ